MYNYLPADFGENCHLYLISNSLVNSPPKVAGLDWNLHLTNQIKNLKFLSICQDLPFKDF